MCEHPFHVDVLPGRVEAKRDVPAGGTHQLDALDLAQEPEGGERRSHHVVAVRGLDKVPGYLSPARTFRSAFSS